MLVFGLFFGALDGCQTHDKRMALMGHSLRAHAVLMLTVNTCFWCSGSQTDGTHVGLVRHSCCLMRAACETLHGAASALRGRADMRN